MNICVFCGSRKGKSIYSEEAIKLADLIVKNNFTLVFGGGSVGLMGIISDHVHKNGGIAIGVITKLLTDKELMQSNLTKLHIVDTMHQRKTIMSDLSDVFIALPGGFGTCDELFEILTWAQLGLHEKPIVLFNIDGFFNHMIDQINHMTNEGFLSKETNSLLKICTSVEQIMEKIT